MATIGRFHVHFFCLFESRANLSRDYFVDRQDRYFLFKNSKELADYFADIVDITLSHSFILNTDGSTTCPKVNPLKSRRTARMFKTSLSKAIKELMATVDGPSSSELSLESSSPELDTVVCPLIQMGFCGIKQDENVTLELLKSLNRDDLLYLASGYFNLPPLYSDALLSTQGTCDVLAASPQVNQ